MSSLIRKSVECMDGYRPGEQPHDRSIIKLNTNENPYPPSPRVVAALHETGLDDMRRYPEPVSRQLREAIAELHGCAVDQVFVGNGSDEILALCTRAFVENEGSVGFFEPWRRKVVCVIRVSGPCRRSCGSRVSACWYQESS